MTEQKRTFLNKVYYYGPNIGTLLGLIKQGALIVLILTVAVKVATL